MDNEDLYECSCGMVLHCNKFDAAYMARSILSHGIHVRYVPSDQTICKQRNYMLFLPNSMPFIINSAILILQIDRDIWIYMNNMA